jgi:hypothetical protein
MTSPTPLLSGGKTITLIERYLLWMHLGSDKINNKCNAKYGWGFSTLLSFELVAPLFVNQSLIAQKKETKRVFLDIKKIPRHTSVFRLLHKGKMATLPFYSLSPFNSQNLTLALLRLSSTIITFWEVW